MHIFPAWIELLALAFCMGALVCRLWVFPHSSSEGSACSLSCNDRILALFGIGAGVLVLLTMVDLLVRATEMSGSPLLSVFPVLQTVLFRTHYGSVWITRIVAEIVLLILWTVMRKRQDSVIYLTFMLALTLVISATESASGHASDKGDFSLPEIADWLHLVAASFWGGGLLIFSYTLLPEILKTDNDQTPTIVAGVARRFSRIAGIAVGVVAITALYNGLTYVGSLEALWSTQYGLAVIAKIILFAVLINLGAVNRYINVPGLQKWAGASEGNGTIKRLMDRFMPPFLRGGTGPEIALRFRRSVKFEAILIIGVFLCAAFLRHDIPARHALHMQHGEGNVPHMHEGMDPHPEPLHNDTDHMHK